MAAETRAIMVAEFDSVAQAAALTTQGQTDFLTRYTGMLRIARLLSSRVMLTDAMLLDGAYFALLGPDRVAAALGAAGGGFPLVVTGTAPSLAEGLAERIAKGDGFRWSLSSAPALWTASGPSGRLHRAWRSWLAAAERGDLTYIPQQGAAGLAPLWEPRLESDAAPGLHRALAQVHARSQALALIDADEAGAVPETERVELYRWWEAAYLHGIGRNVDADWISFDAPAGSRPAADRRTLQLPASFLDWATFCSATAYALARDLTRTPRRNLHRNPDAKGLRELVYAATGPTEPRSRRRTLAGAALSAALALLLIVFAVPGVPLGAVDSPWTWVAFAAAAVGTIPYASLATLASLLRKDETTMVLIHSTRQEVSS